jgi:hypothetical protein
MKISQQRSSRSVSSTKPSSTVRLNQELLRNALCHRFLSAPPGRVSGDGQDAAKRFQLSVCPSLKARPATVSCRSWSPLHNTVFFACSFGACRPSWPRCWRRARSSKRPRRTRSSSSMNWAGGPPRTTGLVRFRTSFVVRFFSSRHLSTHLNCYEC